MAYLRVCPIRLVVTVLHAVSCCMERHHTTTWEHSCITDFYHCATFIIHGCYFGTYWPGVRPPGKPDRPHGCPLIIICLKQKTFRISSATTCIWHRPHTTSNRRTFPPSWVSLRCHRHRHHYPYRHSHHHHHRQQQKHYTITNPNNQQHQHYHHHQQQ